MQQRQLRPGDILDDYCPRERRLTNHVVVAMIGDDIKQTRCTTCDADHEYKHARVPRQRKKTGAAGVLAVAPAPKKIVHDHHDVEPVSAPEEMHNEEPAAEPVHAEHAATDHEAAPLEQIEQESDEREEPPTDQIDEGPVHRPLIRAQLPRIEGQPPATRQNPDFTIRQPGGRPNRFRPRHQRAGGQSFQGNRSNGNMGNTRGGMPRHHGSGRPPLMSHLAKRHGAGGRKRSK